jgi:hypothetical protein
LSVQQTRGVISEVVADNTHDSLEKCVKNITVETLVVKLLQKDLRNISVDTSISAVLFPLFF